MHYRSGGRIRNPLTPYEQNILALVWRTGRLPDEIERQDERWINLMLFDLDARSRARQR